MSIKSLTTYPALLAQVKQTLILGQQRIESEKIKIYWETGNLIYAHIKQYQDRAEYGGEVTERLGRDLKVHRSVLDRCVQFSRTYSKSAIRAGRRKFKWSHYRKLITIADNRQRQRLEARIIDHDWSADELIARTKSEGDSGEASDAKDKTDKEVLLKPLRGQLYTYKIVERPALGSKEESHELRVDLGFGIFKRLDRRTQARFSAGDIIESRVKDERSSPSGTTAPFSGEYYLFTKKGLSKDLYTYEAFVEKVIDGDTLKVRMELGFDFEVRHNLRLRGLDCPEVGTKEGDAAKVFVQSLLKEASRIVLRSSRSDKYDRYLADVFIPSQDGQDDVFLNNLLLEKEFARRMME